MPGPMDFTQVVAAGAFASAGAPATRQSEIAKTVDRRTRTRAFTSGEISGTPSSLRTAALGGDCTTWARTPPRALCRALGLAQPKHGAAHELAEDRDLVRVVAQRACVADEPLGDRQGARVVDLLAREEVLGRLHPPRDVRDRAR